eukprot:CAMPEP_0197024874 /NCGR_PEP_ID=MMETSP1384-20130603/5347_1 /TAXON_ID=29189 /ORGANISM="Ammonia sp." /LENGTH=645 /DNA_ID=CAMNT_0042453331 /DNA_START=24 /DNA_END=1957 /DNA_ORIENTATION=+
MGACATTVPDEKKKDTIQYQYTFREVPQKQRVPDNEDDKDEEEDDTVNHEPIPIAGLIDHSGKEVTRQTPVDPTKSKFPGRKVAIIGAGPAGIHMAALLIKQGYTADQIVILEKTNRACGKSYTLADPDNTDSKSSNDYEGQEIVHELGTCYLHPEYHAITRLLKEYDPDNMQLGIPSRSVLGTNLNTEHEQKSNEPSEQTVNYTDWAMGEIKNLNVNIVPKMFDKLPKMITSGISFEVAIDKYIKIHQEIFGKQSSKISYLHNRIHKNMPLRGFPGRPSAENMKRIDCNFLEFLEQNELQPLIPFFVYSQSVQGYGILDKIPAFYGLFWNTPELMRTVSDLLRISQDKPNVIVLTKGYEHLWQQMIEKEGLNIIYNCNITKLDRHLNDKNKRIEIFYNHNTNPTEQTVATGAGGDESKAEEEETKDEEKKSEESDQVIEADILFLACGCKKALDSFWTDATEEEREIFQCIKPHTLCATLFEYDANPSLTTHQTVVDIWPNICWKGSGQIYAYRNSAKCLMGHDKYDKLLQGGKVKRDRGVAYQFLNRPPIPEQDGPVLENQLRNDLEVWGEKNVQVIRQEPWDYFPMWDQEAVQKGYPWIVKDELQGKYKKTFYIGSSVCFESVLNVVEYNYELCNNYYFDDP